MKLYNVGVDELRDYDLEEINSSKYIWMVYWYDGGSYDGTGEAVAFGKDGLVYFKSLNHCSCYGPMEDGFDKGETIQEFFADKESIFDRECKEVLMARARFLLGLRK
jgi:hypothetical protein